MQKKIHPQYYQKCQVSCACGHQFVTGSTLPAIKVEICARCHPFFTGEEKYVDVLGRVERFKQKQARAAKKKYLKKSLRQNLKKKKEERKTAPRTLKEMLKQ